MSASSCTCGACEASAATPREWLRSSPEALRTCHTVGCQALRTCHTVGCQALRMCHTVVRDNERGALHR
eukprot:201552-Pyramimonas_sp.AAC.2